MPDAAPLPPTRATASAGRVGIAAAAGLGAVLASGPAAGEPGDDGVPVGTVAFFGSEAGSWPVGCPAAHARDRGL